MRLRRGGIRLSLVLTACGPSVGDNASAEGSGGIALPATTVTSSPSGRSTTSATSSTGGRADDTATLLDVAPFPDAPPFPEHCEDPVAEVVVERGVNPQEVVSIDDAALVIDACTYGPTLLISGIRDDGQRVDWRTFGYWESSGGPPFEGSLDLELAEFGGATEATMTLLSPFEDPDPFDANGHVRLRAAIEVLGDGWDLALEVDVPDCGDWTCFCPCE